MTTKQSQFLLAARVGRVPTLMTFLGESNARELFLDYTDPENRSSALHLAAYFDHPAAVQLLLEHKAPLEARTSLGATPLIAAITGSGNPDIVAMLLRAGGDPRAKLSNGASCAHLAVTAPQGGAILRLLKDAGADLDAEDGTGRTPLLYAVEKDRLPACAALLDLGADVERAHPDTRAAPLFVAVHNNQLMIAELLLRAGANPSAAQQDQATAGHIAAQRNRASLLELLLHWGLGPDHADRHGATLLHVAAAGGSAACVDVLASKFGAAVNVQDSFGRTPLFVACSKNHTAAAALLLAKGADSDLPSHAGVLPLEVAASKGYVGPIKLLAPLACRSQLEAARQRAEACPDARAAVVLLTEFLDAPSVPRTFMEAQLALVYAGLAPGTHTLSAQRELWLQGKRERRDPHLEENEGHPAEGAGRGGAGAAALAEMDVNGQHGINKKRKI